MSPKRVKNWACYYTEHWEKGMFRVNHSMNFGYGRTVEDFAIVHRVWLKLLVLFLASFLVLI